MEFQETVETIAAEEASISNLFGGDGVRVRERAQNADHLKKLLEASRLVESVAKGQRPTYYLQEAMSTSDFPILFADILDRQLLGSYREITPVWSTFIGRTTVPDFRLVQRTAIDGAEGRLPEVDELEEYPESELQEAKDTFKVRKYGRRLDLSWETLINDDLQAFLDAPQRLAKGARRTEARLATEMYVDSTGPHADLYSVGNDNIIPGNPEFSAEALQDALIALSAASDVDGEPIDLGYVYLVHGPALEIEVNNVLNATEIRITSGTRETLVANWLRGRVRPVMDPYIPRVATGAEGAKSWFLFADPSDSRPWGQIAFLRGHEDPALYERMPNARRVGGGEVSESFEDDSRAWRVRHVVGGGTLLETGGAKATVASDGSGS